MLFTFIHRVPGSIDLVGVRVIFFSCLIRELCTYERLSMFVIYRGPFSFFGVTRECNGWLGPPGFREKVAILLFRSTFFRRI